MVYNDDGFILVKNSNRQAEIIVNCLKNVSKHIRFTSEEQVGNKLKFLDLRVIMFNIQFLYKVFAEQIDTILRYHTIPIIPNRDNFNLHTNLCNLPIQTSIININVNYNNDVNLKSCSVIIHQNNLF